MCNEWQNLKNHSVSGNEITESGNNNQYIKPWEERLVGNFKWEVQVITIWIFWSILVSLKLGQTAITCLLSWYI